MTTNVVVAMVMIAGYDKSSNDHLVFELIKTRAPVDKADLVMIP